MMFSVDRSLVKCLNGLNLKVALDCSALKASLKIYPESRIAVLTVESSTTERLGRRNDNKIIFRAKSVGARLIVIRIIFPLPIHHKEIFICSGKEEGHLFPHPVFVFFMGWTFGFHWLKSPMSITSLASGDVREKVNLRLLGLSSDFIADMDYLLL